MTAPAAIGTAFQVVMPQKSINPEAAALAVNIQRLRHLNGIRKSRMCDELGISRPTLDKLEAGQCNVCLTLLADISDYFDVSIGELLDFPFRIR